MPDPEIPSQPSLPKRDLPQPPVDFVLLVVPPGKFRIGQIVITANARAALTAEDINMALARHSQCDWGGVSTEDRHANERGVLQQNMILSAYQSAKGLKFWVVTDPGHEITTVLLPEDY